MSEMKQHDNPPIIIVQRDYTTAIVIVMLVAGYLVFSAWDSHTKRLKEAAKKNAEEHFKHLDVKEAGEQAQREAEFKIMLERLGER